MTSIDEMTRSELLAELESHDLTVDDIEGSGTDGYVTVGDIREFLEEVSEESTASFQSTGHVVEGPEDEDEPATGELI